MKTLPTEALDVLQGRTPIISAAAKFTFPSGTFRLWAGHGPLTGIDGDDAFTGIGARALLTPISTSKGGAAESLEIVLSGLDPDIAQTIEAEDYHQRPVVIWRLFFGDEHTLLAPRVFMRGRVDTVAIKETIGGDSRIVINIEGPRRDMDRRGSRIRSDSDQRVLGGASDASLKHVSVAGRKTLAWGQRASTLLGPGRGLLGSGANILGFYR